MTTHWQQRLYDRGIGKLTIERYQINYERWSDGREFWRYPVLGSAGSRVHRRKNLDSGGKPKYHWDFGKKKSKDAEDLTRPADVLYYALGGLVEAIARNEGEVWFVGGEPNVWAMHSAFALNANETINATNWLLGEGTVPDTLVDDLHSWGVKRVFFPFDRDATGIRSAVKVWLKLRDTDIEYTPLHLPGEIGTGYDVNNYWIGWEFDHASFQEHLYTPLLPIVTEDELGEWHKLYFETDEDDAPLWKQQSGSVPEGRSKDLPPRFYQAIETALNIQGYKPNGYSKPIPCIVNNHTHDKDKGRQAAGWHGETKHFKCFKCGAVLNAKETGAALGIDWQDYKDQPAQAASRPRDNYPPDEEDVTAPIEYDTPTPIPSGDAEQAIVSLALLTPHVYLDNCTTLKPEAFQYMSYREIWSAMGTLVTNGSAIDPVTVKDAVRRAGGNLDNVIDQLGSSVFQYDAGAIKDYARIVSTAALRRRLNIAGTQLVMLGKDETKDFGALQSEATRIVVASTSEGTQRRQVNIKQGIGSLVNHMRYLAQREDGLLGIPYGIRELDGILLGAQPGDLTIIAGRPGMGKSALMTTFLMNASLWALQEWGRPLRALLNSLEMPERQVEQRLLSGQSGVNLTKIRVPKLMEGADWTRVFEAETTIEAWDITIDDTGGLTPLELTTAATRLNAQAPLDVILVDYLQLMNGSNPRDNRVVELGHVSRTLKELSRTLDVPVIAGAQLSRAVEQRENKRPQLSDLRESGSIENDADIVVFLYRDGYYNELTTTPNLTELIVAKHRNGETGTASAHFNRSITRFEEAVIRRVNLDDL